VLQRWMRTSILQTRTLQHRVMQGEDAKVFLDGDKLRITVSCKEDAGLLTERIPYALAVTLEVAEPVPSESIRRDKDSHSS